MRTGQMFRLADVPALRPNPEDAGQGQLDSWDWYEIARNEGRLLFIDDIDGRSPVDTGKGDETKTQHTTPPSVL